MSSDLKDLLDLLEQYKNVAGDEIEVFIKDNELTSSDKPTKNYIIFWVYLQWVAAKGHAPMARNTFFKKLKKYFIPASRDIVRRYYVTSPLFSLTKEEQLKAKKECVKEKMHYVSRRNGRNTIGNVNQNHKEARNRNLIKANDALAKLKKGI